MIFNLPVEESFKFNGVNNRGSPKVIFTSKGKKLVSHSAWALLASVADVHDMRGNLASTFVIQEFEDVLFDVLLEFFCS